MEFTTADMLLPRIEAGDKTITTQEIYEAVVMHLGTQRAKALDEQGQCVYRAENGSKCALGALLPDAAYHENIEGYGIDGLCDLPEEAEKVESYHHIQESNTRDFVSKNYDILSSLQLIHDQEQVRTWNVSLRNIAEYDDLNSAVVEYAFR